jgi:hypothetical protein
VKETGVGASFCASHYSPEGQLHGHSYGVKAWFVYAGDARSRKEELNRVLTKMDHSLLPDDLRWGEDIAEHVGLSLLGCTRVEIDRDKEGFYGAWSPDPPPVGRSERSAELQRLYRMNVTYRRIAELLGGTEQGVRSTVRKMVKRAAMKQR